MNNDIFLELCMICVIFIPSLVSEGKVLSLV
jgi:hypothetical protein